MIHAQFRIQLPEGTWVTEVSRVFPDATFKLLSGYRTGKQVIELGEIVTDTPDAIIETLRAHPTIPRFELLEATGKRVLCKYEMTDTELYDFVEASSSTVEFPVVVQDGWFEFELTGTREDLERLRATLETVGLAYELQSLVGTTDTLLTDRQRELLELAVRNGYRSTTGMHPCGPRRDGGYRQGNGEHDSSSWRSEARQVVPEPLGIEGVTCAVTIVGAIHSGTYRRGDPMELDLDSLCTVCGGTIEATYEGERVEVRCPGCERLFTGFGFPPGGFEDRSMTELTSVLGRYVTTIFSFVLRGICFNCSGKTTGWLIEETAWIDDEAPACVEIACDRCGERTTSPVNCYLILHPAVVAFHYDHGVDIDTAEFWNLDLFRSESLTLLSEDPLLIRSTIELDGDRLELVVEDDLSVSVE